MDINGVGFVFHPNGLVVAVTGPESTDGRWNARNVSSGGRSGTLCVTLPRDRFCYAEAGMRDNQESPYGRTVEQNLYLHPMHFGFRYRDQALCARDTPTATNAMTQQRFGAEANPNDAANSLRRLSRQPDHVQVRVLPLELVHLWRAAALADPVAAFKWWEAGNPMGAMLRDEVSSFEAADLFGRLPADFAAKWLLYGDEETELAGWLSPQFWEQLWEALQESDHEDALESWRTESPLGEGLRRHVTKPMLASCWLDLAARWPSEALDYWAQDDELGRALRRSVTPARFVPVWRSVFEENPWSAAIALQRAPRPVLRRVDPFDLVALALSDGTSEAELGYRFVERLGSIGLSKPRDPAGFAAKWRRLAPEHPDLAVHLLAGAPDEVFSELRPSDFVPLLKCDDAQHRQKAMLLLPKVEPRP